VELVIRLATKDDHNYILDLLCEVFGPEYKNLAHNYISAMFSNDFRRPNFVVAYHDKEVIGCAVYTEELFTINVWGISWVAVKEKYREQNIGYNLIKECLNRIRERISSPVTVILDTYPNKTGLYDKLGFKVLGNDHEGGSFMTLTLTPL
jgi:N-acetylglutamate synthase-like GNAT family acetyltransferase